MKADDANWAVNVAGPAYQSTDGTSYEAENAVSGGTIGQIETVKGSQDPALYQTYREGDIRVNRKFANGVYDITFHFAEPAELEAGNGFSMRSSVTHRSSGISTS